MSKAELGRKVPAFKISCTNNQKVSISALKGMNAVLYFYPKDNTPGCTQEGQDFRANYKKFKKQNTMIFGVSRDSLSSHEKFKLKQKFPFELISDEEEKLCKIFDVIKMKNMYGRKFRGIERSTFLINTQGKLCQEWRRIKVKGHAEEVLKAAQELNK
jgi:peroxiredoxin Q/BCP